MLFHNRLLIKTHKHTLTETSHTVKPPTSVCALLFLYIEGAISGDCVGL